PDNWPLLRTALHKMGRADLIGNGAHHLIPKTQPVKIDARIKNADAIYRRRANKLLTQHTGLPPQPSVSTGRQSHDARKPRAASKRPQRTR
ncbi:MAG TPA: DUF3362 domain-containing protein, partial [Pseudomonadales bacterium]|nr:DUF3362 domain-containing protein [Pseudomonadales bacterium]